MKKINPCLRLTAPPAVPKRVRPPLWGHSQTRRWDLPRTLAARANHWLLAELKATPFAGEIPANCVLLTSDTIVWHEGKALGKPKDTADAFAMLHSLSGKTHEVITSVCFTTDEKQVTQHCITKVTFKELSNDEISYYITKYQPFDKAGAYGIQEWIGHIGVIAIEGSYNNVMGLPTHLISKFVNS